MFGAGHARTQTLEANAGTRSSPFGKGMASKFLFLYRTKIDISTALDVTEQHEAGMKGRRSRCGRLTVVEPVETSVCFPQ